MPGWRRSQRAQLSVTPAITFTHCLQDKGSQTIQIAHSRHWGRGTRKELLAECSANPPAGRHPRPGPVPACRDTAHLVASTAARSSTATALRAMLGLWGRGAAFCSR